MSETVRSHTDSSGFIGISEYLKMLLLYSSMGNVPVCLTLPVGQMDQGGLFPSRVCVCQMCVCACMCRPA